MGPQAPEQQQQVVPQPPTDAPEWEFVSSSGDVVDDDDCISRDTNKCHRPQNNQLLRDFNGGVAYDVDQQQTTTTTSGKDDNGQQQQQSDTTTPASATDVFRKTGVAVAGGAMVGVGLIMIPLPTPFGAVIAGSGMAVLGTEFPAAQRVLDRTCNHVADAIEKRVGDDDDNDPTTTTPSDGARQNDTTPETAKKDDDDDDDDDRTTASEEGDNKNMRKEGELMVDFPPIPPIAAANEKMRALLEEQKQKQQQEASSSSASNTLKKSVKTLGKKAVPVIRKIGNGIDKEEIERASTQLKEVASYSTRSISKAAQYTGSSVTYGASKIWRHLLVLDEDEDLMGNPTSKGGTSSPKSVVVDDDATSSSGTATTVGTQ